MASRQKLLLELFPEFTAELERLLPEQGEADLARQVSTLAVLDRCRCGAEFCAMFYVLLKPKRAYGPGHRNVSLDPVEGMVILDVVGDQITAVEVLDRDAIRRKLVVEFPDS